MAQSKYNISTLDKIRQIVQAAKIVKSICQIY